ncbi:restriction endonuclease [Fluviicoccus keumensis]|uniref:Restriction endonuclease n=1 Tax=Fluviicoccus keumensis TaxID=1435465 RepID=A0A4Q7YIC1_9GAMM|nr:restriction endonuclease [Fluviicoccus keumensis]RZU36868.1 restriction endonuclease [Fluviicoccus keumensis]
MSDGKDYEIFVQSLQQALLNSDELGGQRNIEIERNKKIIDNSGIEREFDLYWEYELAGVTYKTIIECKDYASKVSIDKIDALIGKIRDIPDLKPVFATKTGYQSGAEKKAKNNRIDLLIVREQRDDDWEDKDGNPFIREFNIEMNCLTSPRITSFVPVIDKAWLKENTSLEPGQFHLSGLNNAIFIDDKSRGEYYSLYDLQQKLDGNEGKRVNVSYTFEDAYLVGDSLRLKMLSCDVEYIQSRIISNTINIDFQKS